MPVRSGPTLPPSPRCVWHLAHCFLKTSLPLRGVAPLQDDRRRSSSMTFCAVGVGQAAALGEQRLGPLGDRLVRVGGQRLLLVERQESTSAPCPPRSPSSERVRPVGLAEQRQDARLPGRRGQRPAVASTSAVPTLGRLARPQRRRSGRAPASGGVCGVISVEQRRGGLRVGLAEVDRAAGRRRCGRRRSPRSSAAAARRSLRDLGDVRVEPLDCPSATARPSSCAARARRRASAGARRSPSRRRRRASAACPSASPSARPATIGVARPPGRPPRAAPGSRRPRRPGRRGRSARRRGSTTASGRRRRPVATSSRRSPRGTPASCAPRRRSAASGSQRSLVGLRPASSVGRRGRRPRRRRPAASASARSAASRTCGSGSSEQPGVAGSRRRPRRRAAATSDRVPPDAGRRVLQRRDGRRGRLAASPSSAPSPCSVHRAWIAAGVQADRVDRRVRRPASTRSARRPSCPRSTSSRWACSRQNMLSLFSAATSSFGSSFDSVGRLARLAVLR